jgi:hydroxymethylbilane synthase
MSKSTFRIGTRGSELALWQAHWVQGRLRDVHPGTDFEVTVITTKGDHVLDAPLSKIGDKGLFTREIENALLNNQIDLAVHSLKDLPTELPDHLRLGAVTAREDVRDVFLPNPRKNIKTFHEQPHGASIATGSLRRKCQLLHHRPDVVIHDLRGNLNTRFAKLEASEWGGIVLARAGVVRLNRADRIGEIFDPAFLLPAVGQGALGIEIREDDTRTAEMAQTLMDETTLHAVTAERALLRALEGGCQVPIGAWGRMEKGVLVLDAVVGSLDGTSVVRGTSRGAEEDAEKLGDALARQLLREGAAELLSAIRKLSTASQ